MIGAAVLAGPHGMFSVTAGRGCGYRQKTMEDCTFLRQVTG